MGGMKITDSNAEQDLKLVHWVRNNSTPMWFGVDAKGMIQYMDERLSQRLGYYGVHTAMLGKVHIDDIINDPPEDHTAMIAKFIKEGHAPISLSGRETSRFRLKNRDGTAMPAMVRITIMENRFCDGFCTLDGENVKAFGMAEVTFIEDLPTYIRDAMDWFNTNQALIEKIGCPQELSKSSKPLMKESSV